MTSVDKHPVEAADSWSSYVDRRAKYLPNIQHAKGLLRQGQRHLKHHGHPDRNLEPNDNDDDEIEIDIEILEKQQEEEFRKKEKENEEKQRAALAKAEKKRRKQEEALWRESGIQEATVHGMMIDAGSSGSRLHLFEWDPRVLRDEREVEEAVSGLKLSYPGTDSRWTHRLSPGLSEFATVPDDELIDAIAEYLRPLVDFAKTILHTKMKDFGTFPIYLRATAGMRTLSQSDRFRIMNAVRTLFSNNTYCPFDFAEEQARVISGEEEAIFGWAGVNYAMGTLIEDSEGAGTVLNPRLTYGALDMGGASTQISFYEPNGDIMSNLFKLQIGQGKHWNLYAHSFLYSGIDQATDRLGALLISNKAAIDRLNGVYNPCLPGGSKKIFRTAIHLDADGFETWNYTASSSTKSNGFVQAILKNDNKGGDADKCMELAQYLLHKSLNEMCEFSNQGHCSFAGVYQPDLPQQSKNFGEFFAFSNFYHVWNFLDLPARSSLRELGDRTRYACSLSEDELIEFNDGRIDEDEVIDFCFHSAFVFEVLTTGYGFGLDDYITATNVVDGQKVGWALGAMLYEINTMPWRYIGGPTFNESQDNSVFKSITTLFLVEVVSAMLVSLVCMLRSNRRRSHRYRYESIKDASVEMAA